MAKDGYEGWIEVSIQRYAPCISDTFEIVERLETILTLIKRLTRGGTKL